MSIHPLSHGLAGSQFHTSAAVDHRQLKSGRPATPVVNVQPQQRSIGNLPVSYSTTGSTITQRREAKPVCRAAAARCDAGTLPPPPGLLLGSAFHPMVSLSLPNHPDLPAGLAYFSPVNTSWYRRGARIDHRKGTSVASTNRQISRNQAAPGWSGKLMINGSSCERSLLGSATIS